MNSEKPPYEELLEALRALVYAFPARSNVDGLIGGGNAILHAWDVLVRIEPRLADDPLYHEAYRTFGNYS